MFAIILNLQLVAWNIYKLIKLKPHCEICFLEDICKSYIYSVHIHVHVIEKNRVFLHKDISIHTCAWHWKKIRLSFIKLFYKFHSTCNCYRKRGLISQTLTKMLRIWTFKRFYWKQVPYTRNFKKTPNYLNWFNLTQRVKDISKIQKHLIRSADVLLVNANDSSVI